MDKSEVLHQLNELRYYQERMQALLKEGSVNGAVGSMVYLIERMGDKLKAAREEVLRA